MLHRALLSMEFLYVVAPLPSWQHRDSFVGQMSRRPHTAIPPSTPCSRCRWLESKIRAVVLSETHFPFSGTLKCWCGTIATMSS